MTTLQLSSKKDIILGSLLRSVYLTSRTWRSCLQRAKSTWRSLFVYQTLLLYSVEDFVHSPWRYPLIHCLPILPLHVEKQFWQWRCGKEPRENYSSNNKNRSARKDVDWTFGILQSWFTIVRGPAHIWNMDTIKHIIYACIILENWLLKTSDTHIVVIAIMIVLTMTSQQLKYLMVLIPILQHTWKGEHVLVKGKFTGNFKQPWWCVIENASDVRITIKLIFIFT